MALRVKTDQWKYLNQAEKDSYVNIDSREHDVGVWGFLLGPGHLMNM